MAAYQPAFAQPAFPPLAASAHVDISPRKIKNRKKLFIAKTTAPEQLQHKYTKVGPQAWYNVSADKTKIPLNVPLSEGDNFTLFEWFMTKLTKAKSMYLSAVSGLVRFSPLLINDYLECGFVLESDDPVSSVIAIPTIYKTAFRNTWAAVDGFNTAYLPQAFCRPNRDIPAVQNGRLWYPLAPTCFCSISAEQTRQKTDFFFSSDVPKQYDLYENIVAQCLGQLSASAKIIQELVWQTAQPAWLPNEQNISDEVVDKTAIIAAFRWFASCYVNSSAFNQVIEHLSCDPKISQRCDGLHIKNLPTQWGPATKQFLYGMLALSNPDILANVISTIGKTPFISNYNVDFESRVNTSFNASDMRDSSSVITKIPKTYKTEKVNLTVEDYKTLTNIFLSLTGPTSQNYFSVQNNEKLFLWFEPMLSINEIATSIFKTPSSSSMEGLSRPKRSVERTIKYRSVSKAINNMSRNRETSLQFIPQTYTPKPKSSYIYKPYEALAIENGDLAKWQKTKRYELWQKNTSYMLTCIFSLSFYLSNLVRLYKSTNQKYIDIAEVVQMKILNIIRMLAYSAKANINSFISLYQLALNIAQYGESLYLRPVRNWIELKTFAQDLRRYIQENVLQDDIMLQIICSRPFTFPLNTERKMQIGSISVYSQSTSAEKIVEDMVILLREKSAELIAIKTPPETITPIQQPSTIVGPITLSRKRPRKTTEEGEEEEKAEMPPAKQPKRTDTDVNVPTARKSEKTGQAPFVFQPPAEPMTE